MSDEIPKPSVEAIAQRLDAMDEAIRLLRETSSSQPTPGIVMAAVEALKELTDTRFAAAAELVKEKFEGNKTALDAALKTQKEGSDKIESNFTKQTDNVVTNIQTLTKAFDDKINDLKDRFNTSEGRSRGRGDGWGYLVGAVGVVSGIVGIVAVIAFKVA